MHGDDGLFIDGAWRPVADGGTSPVAGPATEKPPGEVSVASAADGKEAPTSAEGGCAARRARTGFEGADALHAMAGEMARRGDGAARAISSEAGKLPVQSARERGLSVDPFRRHA